MRSGKAARGAIGLIALGIVFVMVMNYFGDYRSAEKGEGSGETTSSAEPTTNPPEQDPTSNPEEAPAGGNEEPSSAGTVVVLTDGLKFRKEASRDAEMIGELNEGDRLVYLATEGDWYKVRGEDGTEGFVSSNDQYTKLEK